MASFLTNAGADEYIDAKVNGVYFTPGDSEVVLFTTPPTKAGTDGVEVSGGGYARPLASFAAAAPGSTGRTGQALSDAGILFSNMPVASTAILGIGLADRVTHVIYAVNDSWTPTDPFAVGGNLYIAPGNFALFGKN